MNITIDGIECGIHFGIRSLQIFGRNMSGTTDDNESEIDQFAQAAYAGIDNYYYMKDHRAGTMPVTFEQVYKAVELMALNDDGVSKLKELYIAFGESQVVKSIQEKQKKLSKDEVKDGEKKSQSTGKRSKQRPTGKLA